MIVAYIITVIIINICRRSNPYKADRWFKKLQLVSSALFSLGHGGNDSQKVMGIISAALLVYSTHLASIGQVPPDWAVVKQVAGAGGQIEDRSYSKLGSDSLLQRHRFWNHDGRMENRKNHGHQDHESNPTGRRKC